MQRDREVKENSNTSGSPFDSFGGFGFRGSMFPSIFGGKDPFDDPFFSRPYGSLFGSGMFSSNSPGNVQHTSRSKGPVIEELDSDAEEVPEGEEEDDVNSTAWLNRNPLVEHPEDQGNGKLDASCFYHLQNGVCLLTIVPNMADQGKSTSKRREVSYTTNHDKVEIKQPPTHSVSFQRVTYGGINGAYYTATTSRRTGNDGVCLFYSL